MKAQIEFNWIFTIIVGAIILLFFFGFTLKYRDLQEKKQEIILLNNFDNSLKLLEKSSFQTSTDLDLYNEINVRCDNNRIYLNNEETNNIIFSEKNLNNKIFILYQPYKVPFFITNIYYIIGSKRYYIVVNNDQDLNSFVDSLIEELPDDFKNRVVKTNSYNPNDRKNRYISFIGDADVHIVSDQDYNYGSLIIANQEYNYYGREMLYGAIFSEDYGCLLDIVKARMDNAILMYENKINVIKKEGCSYNAILSELENLRQGFDKQKVDNIEELNKNLANLNCPVLY